MNESEAPYPSWRGGVLTWSYTYDPLGRRIHKQVNDGSQVTATANVNPPAADLGRPGWRCIEEWEARNAE